MMYSLGVLKLELLTGMQPNKMANDGVDLDHLVDVFVSAVGNSSMLEMIENEILDLWGRNEIEQVARLALKCVAKKGTERPTTIQIVSELRLIEVQKANK